MNNKVIQFLETCRLTCVGWEEPRVYPLIDGSHIVYFPVRNDKLLTVTIRNDDVWSICITEVHDITKPPLRRRVREEEEEALLLVRQFLQPPVKRNTKSYLFVGAVSIVVALAYSMGYLLQGG